MPDVRLDGVEEREGGFITNGELRIEAERLCDENERLRDENMRLRSCLSDDADNARQILGENAKLRELVRAAWKCTHSGLSCSDCRMIAGGCTLQSAMRELGIEVKA